MLDLMYDLRFMHRSTDTEQRYIFCIVRSERHGEDTQSPGPAKTWLLAGVSLGLRGSLGRPGALKVAEGVAWGTGFRWFSGRPPADDTRVVTPLAIFGGYRAAIAPSG